MEKSPSNEAIEKMRFDRKMNWFKKDSLCKGCGNNQKKNGSRWCGDCSLRHVAQVLNNKKLEKKIAGSIN